MLHKEVIKVGLVPLLLPPFLDTTVFKAWQPPCSCSLPAASIIDAVSSSSPPYVIITKRELAQLRHTSMNKQLCALVSCVIVLALLHLPHRAPVDVSASSQSPTTEEQSPGRKLLKESVQVIQTTKEPKHGHEEEEGHIYETDYSLVATHPPPLPKRHPKPKS
ncbi:hypothetical protein BHM03_00016944 [Ensete ventricosum]|nr:hypothetical protein BHM03_00016944 [Ensete ventricosum]